MLLRENVNRCKRYATSKPARNEKMLKYYFSLMKSEGERAFALSKKYLYDKCGDVFDITGTEAGRIIRWMIIEKQYKNFLSPAECDEYLDILLHFQNKKGEAGRYERRGG